MHSVTALASSHSVAETAIRAHQSIETDMEMIDSFESQSAIAAEMNVQIDKHVDLSIDTLVRALDCYFYVSFVACSVSSSHMKTGGVLQTGHKRAALVHSAAKGDEWHHVHRLLVLILTCCERLHATS